MNEEIVEVSNVNEILYSMLESDSEGTVQEKRNRL